MPARKLFVPLLLVAFAASFAWSQDSNRDFHWTGKLAPDNVIEIRNINGDIEAQAASGEEVEVNAEKRGPNADEVKIEVAKRPDGVVICAIYPNMRDEGNCEQSEHWHSHDSGEHAKVIFHVMVPADIRFSGKNVNGGVMAEDMGRVVHAVTVNGSVRVSTKSWAQASSVNGSVEVSMGKADWTDTLKIDSVNGSIHLSLPSDLNADIRFSSVNGRLESDFPLTVEGSLGGHKVSGRIGSGGRELRVSTVNGSVELRRNGV